MNAYPYEVEFVKAACGSGDYLVLRSRWEDLEGGVFQDLAKRLCPRRSGVGARGLIALKRSELHDPVTEVSVTSPFYSPDFLAFDAFFCASRVLFDSARFGTKPLKLHSHERLFSIESVDSQNFRTELWPPTNGGRPIDENRSLFREDLESAGIPLELHQKITACYKPASSARTLKRALAQEVSTSPGRATVYYSVLKQDLILACVKNRNVYDFVSTAGLTALAGFLEGFTSDEMVVSLNDQPFFVQIQFPGPKIWVTAPVRYVFSGSFSEDLSPSFFA